MKSFKTILWENWKKHKEGFRLPNLGSIASAPSTTITHDSPGVHLAFHEKKKGHYVVAPEFSNPNKTYREPGETDHRSIHDKISRFVERVKPASIDLGHHDPIRHKALALIASKIAKKHSGELSSDSDSHKVKFKPKAG